MADSKSTVAKSTVINNTVTNNTVANSESSKDPNIWEFIPLSEYSAPTEPPTEQIRTGLMAFWGRLRRGATTLTPEQDSEEIQEEEENIQQDVEQLAAWPNWIAPATDALDRALEQWRAAADDKAGARVLVAPPHSKIEAILERWAKRHAYRIIEPPTYVQMLRDPDEWLEQLPLESGARFVILALERCYLRHYNGLDLVRRLTQRIWEKGLPCVLGCQSWAWAYLDFSCRVGMLDPVPLTLAPLDAEKISRWIAATRPPQEAHIFRRTDTGIEVYPIHAREEAKDQKSTDQNSNKKEYSSEFLVHIAAHAQGNPGIIWALWRKSLAITDRHEVNEKARTAAQADRDATAWVKKWETMELPAVPATLSDSGAFALHAILLHGGLRFDEIEYLVPGVSLQLAQDLRALQQAQIVEICEERFYVTPLGYPTARAYLGEESFMVDGLT